jgi:uncharacterized protein YjbI with pentapeptide repeats
MGLILVAYSLHLSWTGFLQKTLWDWLQLLLVPLVLALGVWILIVANNRNGRRIARGHQQQAQDLAADQQREALLQDFLTRLSAFLLYSDLRGSDPKSEVRSVAKALTLTTLPRLDGRRKRSLLRFLYEAGLIGTQEANSIIPLNGADLHGANLHGANLGGADLSQVDLREADLRGTRLHGANLSQADLQRANLSEANLHGALLQEARLSQARLSRVDLHETDLQGANLSGTDLSDAALHEANLAAADLRMANLSGADLRMANVREVQIAGANLSHARLSKTLAARVQRERVPPPKRG